MKNLEEKKLPFWIYDEKGYPSGYAGGITSAAVDGLKMAEAIVARFARPTMLG